MKWRLLRVSPPPTYSNSNGPSAPFAAALTGADVPPATARITSAQLIALNRDHRIHQ
ncbi:hypothetical protein [Streptomyces sp. NBC_01187]|uniref:hypothetical protein n=1 Tax=Streptomyces sp. NBC_01187 TaxID=2903766 RepID=UPI0038693F61|nr:hypothetical protein OG220_42065 [Streptomyces sp. NBC_01187]